MIPTEIIEINIDDGHIYCMQNVNLSKFNVYRMLRLYCYISPFRDDTFGRKISAKNMVVRTSIPATNIPVPMLMYVLRENDTSASTTITILEM